MIVSQFEARLWYGILVPLSRHEIIQYLMFFMYFELRVHASVFYVYLNLDQIIMWIKMDYIANCCLDVVNS